MLYIKMAKRFRKGRKRFGRKRMFRKKAKKGIRDLRTKVTYLRKGYQGVTYNASGGYAFNFLLSSVPDVASIKALYDQYMISGIKMTFVPESTVNAWNDTLGAMKPIARMVIVVDRDDSSLPASENALMEYNYKKIWLMNKARSIYFKPSTLGMLYQSAVATSYTPKQDQWIRSPNDEVPHYGLKYWFTNVTADVVITTYITLYLKLRSGL